MKLIFILALAAFCNAGYPAAEPEITADSYSTPIAQADSYAPPIKATAVTVETVPEPAPAVVPETVITETAAAAPSGSAAFNFLSELAPPAVLTVEVPETTVKAAPVVQEAINLPTSEQFQLNIPGLVPPVTTIPLPPVTPPVVFPPATLPPAQAPIPVQSLPVQVQPLALEAIPAPVPSTKIATEIQSIPIQRFQTAVISQPSILQSSLSYAPYFLPASSLPTSFVPTQNILPQIELATSTLSEPLSIQSGPVVTGLETPAKATSVLIRAPATRYGSPAFEALKKK